LGIIADLKYCKRINMLVGKLRESIGSASARRLRRDGYLTANIYAKGVDIFR